MCLGEATRGAITGPVIMTGGWQEKSIPCGIVDEESGQLSITFGSSYKTSDFIVEALEAWWAALDTNEQVAMARLQIKMDNGPESRRHSACPC